MDNVSQMSKNCIYCSILFYFLSYSILNLINNLLIIDTHHCNPILLHLNVQSASVWAQNEPTAPPQRCFCHNWPDFN